jgi:DNA polymerase I
LYNPHDAAAVTITGQAVIKHTAERVDTETPGEVVYGDTDSVYCQWPNNWGQVKTLEYVEEFCDVLNNHHYPDLCEEYGIDPDENRWKMELEKRCTMFMSNQKKKYATNVQWAEGMPFDEVLVA